MENTNSPRQDRFRGMNYFILFIEGCEGVASYVTESNWVDVYLFFCRFFFGALYVLYGFIGVIVCSLMVRDFMCKYRGRVLKFKGWNFYKLPLLLFS